MLNIYVGDIVLKALKLSACFIFMATSVTDKIITAILFIFKKIKDVFLNYKTDNTELLNG